MRMLARWCVSEHGLAGRLLMLESGTLMNWNVDTATGLAMVIFSVDWVI
jgi:hypothetical protein